MGLVSRITYLVLPTASSDPPVALPEQNIFHKPFVSAVQGRLLRTL